MNVGLMSFEEMKDRQPKRGKKSIPRDVAPTLTCGFGGGPTRKKCAVLDKTVSGVPFLRDISVREGAKLQGFPEEWVFPENKTEAWTLIGNAVALPVAKAIATHLIAISEGGNPPAKTQRYKDEIKAESARQYDDAPPEIGFSEMESPDEFKHTI